MVIDVPLARDTTSRPSSDFTGTWSNGAPEVGAVISQLPPDGVPSFPARVSSSIYIKRELGLVEVAHVWREQNRCANAMAKAGMEKLGSEEETTIFLSPPPFVCDH